MSLSLMRICKVCAKPASEWEPRLLCDEHLREYRRSFNLRRRGKDAELARKRYAANPQKQLAASSRWTAGNPERKLLIVGASRYVSWAIRTGLLTRPDRCERCGFGGLIEAAHADYGRPLQVEWLCRSCHRIWDRATPKTLPRLAMVVFDEDEEPDRNGEDDSGQESGLAGGGKDGDGPSLD